MEAAIAGYDAEAFYPMGRQENLHGIHDDGVIRRVHPIPELLHGSNPEFLKTVLPAAHRR
jgi:hypothetical protein